MMEYNPSWVSTLDRNHDLTNRSVAQSYDIGKYGNLSSLQDRNKSNDNLDSLRQSRDLPTNLKARPSQGRLKTITKGATNQAMNAK